MSERGFREPRRRGFANEVFTPRRPRQSGGTAPQRQTLTGPPVRATVKWFSPEKGFGFVVLEDGSGDAFLHASVVEQCGHNPADLPSGASLQVRIEAGQKGSQVGEVLQVDKTTATVRPQNASDRRVAREPVRRGHTTRMTGTVKWYSPEKRFGFVAVEGGQREVFVHADVLQRSRLAGLAEGQRVALEVAEGHKGLEATSVSLTG